VGFDSPRLTDRCKEILAILACSSKPVTCKNLAEQLDISERTLRKELAPLKRWASSRGIGLLVKPRVGVLLRADEKTLSALKEAKPRLREFSQAKSRVPYILWRILLEDDPVQLEDLASALSVSRNTLRKDLTKVRQWLESRGIKLMRCKEGAIVIECSEWSRRMALCEVAQVSATSDYTAAAQLVESVLHDAQKSGKLNLRGSVYYSVACYLAIAVLRVQTGKTLFGREIPWVRQAKEFDTLTGIFRMLESRLRRYMPESEIAAACTYVMSISSAETNLPAEEGPSGDTGYVAANPKDVGESPKPKHQSDATLGSSAYPNGSSPVRPRIAFSGQDAAQLLAILVGNAIGADLLADEVLIKDLGAHLTLAFARLATGTVTYNPFKDDLQKMYPRLYHYTAVACSRLSDLMGLPFPEHELAYVVMYMGAAFERYSRGTLSCIVVCASGTGVAKFLSERIMTAFPTIQVRALVPVPYLNTALAESPVDLVISPTKAFSTGTINGCPVIVVDPMLPAQDRALLAKFVDGARDPSSTFGRSGARVPARFLAEAKRICDKIRNTLGIDTDPMTVKALGVHLDFARQRLRRGQFLSQPVEEFRSKYPQIFDVVKRILEEIKVFPTDNVPDEEVVPVMLYFIGR